MKDSRASVGGWLTEHSLILVRLEDLTANRNWTCTKGEKQGELSHKISKQFVSIDYTQTWRHVGFNHFHPRWSLTNSHLWQKNSQFFISIVWISKTKNTVHWWRIERNYYAFLKAIFYFQCFFTAKRLSISSKKRFYCNHRFGNGNTNL